MVFRSSTQQQLASLSLQFLPQKPSGWKRKVLLGSGLNSKGLAEVWESVQDYFNTVQSNSYFKENRKRQDELRVVEYIKEQVSNRVKNLYKENYSNDMELTNPYLIAEKWVKENLK